MLGGTTLVISPLISLMQDQVAALTARGVAATFPAATLSGDEVRRRYRRAGEYAITYVAPERLAFPGSAVWRATWMPARGHRRGALHSEWARLPPGYLQLGELGPT